MNSIKCTDKSNMLIIANCLIREGYLIKTKCLKDGYYIEIFSDEDYEKLMFEIDDGYHE